MCRKSLSTLMLLIMVLSSYATLAVEKKDKPVITQQTQQVIKQQQAELRKKLKVLWAEAETTYKEEKLDQSIQLLIEILPLSKKVHGEVDKDVAEC